MDNFKLKDLIYLALRDAANNIKACFYTEECDIEAIDDILHSLQTVIGHNIFCLETVKNIDAKLKKIVAYGTIHTDQLVQKKGGGRRLY